MISNFQASCTDISIDGNVVSANCKKIDGTWQKSSIVLMGIENIDGQLQQTNDDEVSNYHLTCTDISIDGNVVSANCKKIDGTWQKSSIVLMGIENIDGQLQQTINGGVSNYHLTNNESPIN